MIQKPKDLTLVKLEWKVLPGLIEVGEIEPSMTQADAEVVLPKA